MENRKTKSKAGIIFVGLFQLAVFVICLWLIWGLDIWMGISLTYPAYIVAGVISLGILMFPVLVERRWFITVIPAVWTLILTALPLLPNSPLKPLLWGMRDLDQSVDRDTIIATLEKKYQGTDFPGFYVNSEEANRICIKLNGRPPELGAESLIVLLEDGRYSRALFHAD